MTPTPWRSINCRLPGEVGVSRSGTLAVADITVRPAIEVITVVSMYGAWEDPAIPGAKWLYADASVHRVISDLSGLIDRQRGHKIIAAGDLNVLYGYGEGGSPYWRDRYAAIFSRMEALGLPFVGPQAPDGGCPARPWPDELPKESKNVPTFRSKIKQPETATRQLDFFFASKEWKPRLTVRALNAPDDPDEWGPSDHCRVLIELRPA